VIEGYTYRHTERWEGFMKYAVEMGSGAMIYTSSYIKLGSGTQMLMGGYIYRRIQRHRQPGDFISLLLFFSK
jgi:hypothetical protein